MAPLTNTRDPLTERGRRTREALVAAGRTVFEQRGYADTRMGDIADAAGVAHGTVYTYFEDKPAIFRAVVDDLVGQLEREWRVGAESADPVVRIERANRSFLASFASHVRLLDVVEQAAVVDSYYAELLESFRQRYVERAVAGIRRMQSDGLVSSDIDPYVAGSALCAMVEGFGRQWMRRGEQHDPDHVTRLLTELWARALGLPTSPAAAIGATGQVSASRPAHPEE